MSEINLKILLIGDSSVGKTSILLRYVDDEFNDSYISTIGIEYKIKTINVNNKKITMRIWDTSGQERYRSITQNFYRNANGILFVFDVTKKESFNNIKLWLTDSQNCEANISKILIGNKIDLEEEREVSNETIKNFANKKEMKFFETSAKEGTNIDLIFRELAELILSNKCEESEVLDVNNNNDIYNSFNLINEDEKGRDSKSKKKCC